ncbi:MAG TPA: preprotein translocase subunit SecE [Candidatus Pacebacteria bacterium]|nr:MAG: preprotein translocase subunit SecE [Candidatus Gottesmanbacteria bacterium RIFCSPHIGHO2_01_FULL_43_15]HAV15625.1 preprotein translocase subunit SecE [Candidatus Paceibacterota bacterium]
MATTINPVTFIKEVRTELAKVIWPNRQETIKLTLVVILVSLGIGLYIGGLDIIFVKLTELLIKR